MVSLIEQIEAILKPLKLHSPLKPDGDRDLLDYVLRIKENHPKYALDARGNIIALNLAKSGLTDEKWHKILALPGLAEHLRALNLTENALTAFPFPSDGGLQKLKNLRLAENQIKEFALPPDMEGLTDLELEDNPLESPPQMLWRLGRLKSLNG